MRRWVVGGLVAVVALGAVLRPAAGAADGSREQQAVAETIRAVFRAAELKQVDLLESYHLYGPQFTKFDEFGGGREDAAATQAAEGRAVAAVKTFKANVENLKVDLLGQAAVATFIVTYSAELAEGTATGRLRSTVVLAKHGRSWKIVHEHYSALRAKE